MRPLLPLPLEGRGTRDIEALPSYLSRLAAAHGVTPGGLFLYLLNGYEGGVSLSKALGAQPFSASVRPNLTAERAIEVLSLGRCEEGEQLRRATFLHLSPALARSQKAYTKRLRWCPGCLYEQCLANKPSYLKLCWFLEDVKACDVHRVVLRDACPHCKKVPRPWSGWPDFSRCQRCNGRLDVVSSCDHVELDPGACAPDLIQLVGGIAVRSTPFSAGVVNRYVDRVFDEAWASEREMALWEKLPRDDCLRYSLPDEPITLAVARKIAFRLEVPILEMLDSDLPSIRSFGFGAESALPAPMRPGRKEKTIDRLALTRSLKEILEGSSEPISIPRVAKRLSVSVGAIRYHCPELAGRLVDRCVAFRRSEANRKQSEAFTVVKATILGWDATMGPMSKKSVLRYTRLKSGLPKNLLISEIKSQWDA